jgi:DNA repair photolyase
MEYIKDPFKGRGALSNLPNAYLVQKRVQHALDGIDELKPEGCSKTIFFKEHAKRVVNNIKSEDLRIEYSINPYQGCEHGCIYCYARPTHEYYGFSSGLDFEQKIMYKYNAADILRKTFKSPNWKVGPIQLSGNTDCYQPIERKMQLTRRLLELCYEYKNPVGIITKNSLVLRDKHDLVHVWMSINGQDEGLRRVLEPRTSTYEQRFQTIKELSSEGIPCGVMLAPIIPGLNEQHIPYLLEKSAEQGALNAAYILVRLNGDSLGKLFSDWIQEHFPDRAQKVLNAIKASHKGSLSDYRKGLRFTGDGKQAESIAQLFKIHKKKYFEDKHMPAYNLSIFSIPDPQYKLF